MAESVGRPFGLFPGGGLNDLVARPRRGGRLSLTANLSYEPPSPRDARPVHLGPSPSVHRPTRLTRPLAGAGSQASPPGRRASSERGAGARDILSKPACRCMPLLCDERGRVGGREVGSTDWFAATIVAHIGRPMASTTGCGCTSTTAWTRSSDTLPDDTVRLTGEAVVARQVCQVCCPARGRGWRLHAAASAASAAATDGGALGAP